MFEHLNIPNRWKHEWTKYPEGYTILEALFNWVKQVNDMVDNQNELSDKVTTFRTELDDFIERFDPRLQEEVTNILSEWQSSGYLDVVIDAALQTQIDDVAAQLAQTEAKKIDKDGAGQVTWANIAQDVREQIIGEVPPAVVGKNSVSTENIVDNSVTHEKISFLEPGKNLFDKSTVRHDRRIDYSNGNLLEVPDVSTSMPIKVTPLESYYRNIKDAYAILDSGGNLLDGGSSNSKNNVIHIPENGSHIILSVKTEFIDQFQFEKGTEETGYKLYGAKISKEIDLDIQLEELPTVEYGPVSKNLLSRQPIYVDSRVDLSWNPDNNSWVATLAEQATWTYFTIKVPVERNRTYHFRQEIKTLSGDEPYFSTRIKDMDWEPGGAAREPTLLSTTQENATFNSGDNDFVFVNFYPYNAGTFEIKNAQIELGSNYTGYEEYEEGTYIKPEYLRKSNTESDNPPRSYWEDKTVIFNGDSIAAGWTPAGYDTITPYPNRTAENLEFNLINYSIGGSTLGLWNGDGEQPRDRTPLVSRIDEMTEDADAVFIAIGTNDWRYQWAPLGTMSDRTSSTFYGALHVYVLALLERYSGKPITFITPIKRGSKENETNDNENTLIEYRNAIVEVCNYYSVPVFDAYNESMLNTHVASQAIMYVPDSTHPNNDGHKIFARRFIGYLKQLA